MRGRTMRGLIQAFFLLLIIVYVSLAVSASNSSSSSSNSSQSSQAGQSKATQARQSPMSAASAFVGALGTLVPGLISNVAPFVLLAGLGALMMPQLGLSAMGLLRESRRSAQDPLQQQLPLAAQINYPQFNGLPRPIQTTPNDIYYFTKRSLGGGQQNSWMPSSEQLMQGLHEVLERVSQALENAEKRYN